MLPEILLALIQAATEFLPVSSSGHLALVSNLISSPDLFFITTLHLASLFAVLVYTSSEIKEILRFNKESFQMIKFLIIATIPAALFGFLFSSFIEKTFSSLLLIGISFIFTSIILFLTKYTKPYDKLNSKNSFLIGLFQVLALFPGVSRSGMTISSGLFLGLNKKRAARFSFLLLIPLVIGAVILEFGKIYFSFTLLISFIITFFASLIFLNILEKIIVKDKFWMFSFYCFLIGLITLIIYFF